MLIRELTNFSGHVFSWDFLLGKPLTHLKYHFKHDVYNLMSKKHVKNILFDHFSATIGFINLYTGRKSYGWLLYDGGIQGTRTSKCMNYSLYIKNFERKTNPQSVRINKVYIS